MDHLLDQYVPWIIGGAIVTILLLWSITWWALGQLFKGWRSQNDMTHKRIEVLEGEVGAIKDYLAKQLDKEEVLQLHREQTRKFETLERKLEGKIEAYTNTITHRLDLLINRQHNQRAGD